MASGVLLAVILFSLSCLSKDTWAYREYFTLEQKEQLAKIRTILVEAIALTDKGAVDAAAIADMAARRLSEVGYDATTEPSQPHDVVVRVKCEQRKKWEGTTTRGGDADLPDSPSRVWKGPACQLNYLLDGVKIRWQKEVRTDFEDAVAAAQTANEPDPGEYAMAKLRARMENHPFPLLLTAEWGQADRLLKVLDAPGTRHMRKLKVISLLGEMQADEAFPKLKEALKDRDLAKQAVVALGGTGKDAIPILIDMMKNSKDPELQAAAAKGLGQLSGVHGDASVIPPLLDMLFKPDIDIAVRTEVVWALGKIPDKRAIEPLHQLDRELQAKRSDDPAFKKLKEAAFWSLKMTDTELSSENP